MHPPSQMLPSVQKRLNRLSEKPAEAFLVFSGVTGCKRLDLKGQLAAD